MIKKREIIIIYNNSGNSNINSKSNGDNNIDIKNDGNNNNKTDVDKSSNMYIKYIKHTSKIMV